MNGEGSSNDRFIPNPFPASQSGPNTEKSDLEYCNGCGQSGDPANMGFFVDTCDIGEDAEGGVAEVFRLDVEEQGQKEWLGFTEEDLGYWCDDCSWRLQRKRTRNTRSVESAGNQND